MKEQTIVGAGLSGMVAAITLARKGYRVSIRERRGRIGGPIRFERNDHETVIMAGDGTPMDLDAMERYTGIDFKPVAVPIPFLELHLYGRYREFGFAPGMTTYLFERGPRSSSLDMYLYEMARDLGVEFRFDDPLTDREQFGKLSPGTIVATGLYREAMEAMDIPSVPGWGYYANGPADEDAPTRVVIYFDRFTRDYGFATRLKGIQSAMVFSRQWPMREQVREEFREALMVNEGIELENWSLVNSRIPVKSFRPPGLFWRHLILTGNIAGVIDPLMHFGVHGALVSGRIAALAVEEPIIAERELQRINRIFPLTLVGSYLFRYLPLPVISWIMWHGTGLFARSGGRVQRSVFSIIPGYGVI